MKTSDGFVKTTIAGIPYLLPYGQKIADHARSLRLNDSGALLWDTLSLGADKSTLLSVLANYYNTDADMLPQLTSDLDSYLASLKQLGMLSYNAPAENFPPHSDQTDNTFPALFSDDRAPKYYKIGGLCFSWFGPDDLFDTYFKDFSCEAAVADQRIFIITGKPSHLADGTLLLHTTELTIFDVTDTYRFVFGTHWGIHEMRVKKDGSAAVLYCVDADNKDHAENIFHALRFAFLIAAQKAGSFCPALRFYFLSGKSLALFRQLRHRQIHTREPLGEPVSYSGFKRRLKCTWHQERPALSIRSALVRDVRNIHHHHLSTWRYRVFKTGSFQPGELSPTG